MPQHRENETEEWKKRYRLLAKELEEVENTIEEIQKRLYVVEKRTNAQEGNQNNE